MKRKNKAEKELIDMRKRDHKDYSDYRLSTNKITGNKKACYPAPNPQLISSKNNETNQTSLDNQSGKSIEIKKQKEKETKIMQISLKYKRSIWKKTIWKNCKL